MIKETIVLLTWSDTGVLYSNIEYYVFFSLGKSF
jgi:hypothetical protein